MRQGYHRGRLQCYTPVLVSRAVRARPAAPLGVEIWELKLHHRLVKESSPAVVVGSVCLRAQSTAVLWQARLQAHPKARLRVRREVLVGVWAVVADPEVAMVAVASGVPP